MKIEPIAMRTRGGIIKAKNRLWVSATKTHNFLLGDTLIDWLNLYGKTKKTRHKNYKVNTSKTFTDFIKKRGDQFEKKVIDFYKNTFDLVKVADFYTVKDAQKTFNFMKKGIPIIYSAPIYNTKNNTYGIIDLLVRSDYINKLFKEQIIEPHLETKKAPKLMGNFHYLVIDIKWTTLNLCADGKHLLNTGRIPAYKSQLYVYNQAISEFQGYNPNKSFILGRRWSYTSKGQTFSGNNCNDRLGVIDYKTKDKDIIDKTRDAIEWIRDVNKKGINWCPYTESKIELYPNMCRDSGIWNNMKSKIANNIGEISMIWQCGEKQRKLAHSQGIISWKDERCNSKVLGFKEGSDRSKIIDNILCVNREDKPIIMLREDWIWPEYHHNEIYVDFETFTDICESVDKVVEVNNIHQIFMIGVGKQNELGVWEYSSFICKDKTKVEEKRIIQEFYDFYKELGSPPMYYWCAEKSFLKRSCKEHNIQLSIDMYDMCELFKDNYISITGCFGYGLKEIVKVMKYNNLIDTKLESECRNGMMAMIKAFKCYENSKKPHRHPIMKDISKYNEFDCKAIFDINHWIRNNLL